MLSSVCISPNKLLVVPLNKNYEVKRSESKWYENIMAETKPKWTFFQLFFYREKSMCAPIWRRWEPLHSATSTLFFTIYFFPSVSMFSMMTCEWKMKNHLHTLFVRLFCFSVFARLQQSKYNTNNTTKKFTHLKTKHDGNNACHKCR